MKSISLLLVLSLFLAGAAPAQDTLRIVSYNLLNYPGSDAAERNHYFRTIMASLPCDIFVAQEMQSQTGVNWFRDSVLNVVHPGRYSSVAFNDGPDTDNALFYNPATATVLSASYIRTSLRDIAEYVIEEAGSGETLRIYSVHLKASSGSTNEQRRLDEATTLRAYLNALPAGSQFMIVGDYNIYRSSEPAFEKLLGSETDNDGRVKDPLNAVGTWNSSSFASIHTQSPRTRSFGSGSTGGMDDRFDIMLISYALDDNIILSSYQAYGNDGNHYNDSINKMPNTAVSQSVADALHYASDHLPVTCSFVFQTALPIELASFSGNAAGATVELQWVTASETNSYGFYIERRSSAGSYETVSGLIAGAGTTLEEQRYTYRDESIPAIGTYYYRLRQIDLNGDSTYSPEVAVEVSTLLGVSDRDESPLTFGLEQNYPNPFNPTTHLQFTIVNLQFVSLKIFDILGHEVAELVGKEMEPGEYTAAWDASGLPGGVYFAKLASGLHEETRGLVLVK